MDRQWLHSPPLITMEGPMNTYSPTTTRNPLGSDSTAQRGESTDNTLRNVAELGGRVLLSVLFLISGLGKIGAYTSTAGYMTALGVPGALLPAVIATQLLGAFPLSC